MKHNYNLRKEEMKLKLVMAVLLLAAASANAAPQEDFGIGLIVGEPTGLSLKYWLDDERAIDAAAAESFSENDSFQLHGDYLIHDYDLFGADELPFYCGLGARLKLKDDDGSGRNRRHDIFGIRIPLGITYIFEDAAVDLFFELVPVLDLSPEVELDIGAAAGIRFYF